MEIPSPDKGDYAKKVYKKAEKDFLKMYVIFDDSYKESYWSVFLMGGFLGDIKKHTNKACGLVSH